MDCDNLNRDALNALCSYARGLGVVLDAFKVDFNAREIEIDSPELFGNLAQKAGIKRLSRGKEGNLMYLLSFPAGVSSDERNGAKEDDIEDVWSVVLAEGSEEFLKRYGRKYGFFPSSRRSTTVVLGDAG